MDVSGSYEWSLDLVNWYAGDGVDGPANGVTVAISSNTEGSNTTVTAAASEEVERVFFQVVGTLIAP